MSTYDLLSNPRNIGEIFFSGSQSVQKGQAVTWILDETWAFKTTEAVGVSCNSTPFVQLRQGETFIIKQGALYIFDNDTVLALAYPQEVSQEIVIENDIYNNNLSTIIVESDKTPVAKIVATESTLELGESIVLASNSYSPDNPPQDLTQRWIINGVEVSTAVSFSYTPTKTGGHDVLLIVEDEDGRLGDASYTFVVNEKVYLRNIYTDGDQYQGNATVGAWTNIFSILTDEATPNANNAVQFTASFGQTWSTSKAYYPATITLRLTVNGSQVWSKSYTNTQIDYQTALTVVDQFTFNRAIGLGDTIHMDVTWAETGNQYQSVTSVCQFCINGDLQVTATEQ